MSTPADAAPASDATPPRFYPLNFHPEFGYLCPRPSFRQRVRFACKAAVFGALVGAIAVFALAPRYPSAEFTAAAARPSPAGPVAVAEFAYGGACGISPWPYAGTGCLAKRPTAWEPERVADQADAAHAVVTEPVAEAAPAPVEPRRAAPVKPVKKAAKTLKRERRREPELRERRRELEPPEPDPRTAYAERFAEPRPPAIVPGGPLGGYGGGFGGGWRW
jgi:hypothetical protein